MALDVKQDLDELSQSGYLRQRLDPRPGDQMYLHLSDLLIGLRELAPTKPARLLDFGCGGSPYRALFPQAQYERADLAGVKDTDFEITSDANSTCHIAAEAQRYDIVLSSQVLEHVPSPHDYLREANRVLKPGGHLLLSTHGIFEDHGCPHDYRRWTSRGLVADLESAGFRTTQIKKLTTGPRAAIFLLQNHRRTCGRSSLAGLWMWSFKLMNRFGRARFDRQCDRHYADCRSVSDDQEKHRIYVALLVLAEKLHA